MDLAVNNLIVPKVLEKRKMEEKAAQAAQEKALAFKLLQDKAGVNLKLACKLTLAFSCKILL